MGKSKKKTFLGAKSSNVIKWVKQNKKQRFKCKSCGLLFTQTNELVSQGK